MISPFKNGSANIGQRVKKTNFLPENRLIPSKSQFYLFQGLFSSSKWQGLPLQRSKNR